MRDRPIRVLIAKPGLDGHDVGAKVLCRALRDAGMEVIYTGLRQSPKAIAAATLQEDARVLGLSVLSGAHLPLCRRIGELLEEQGGLSGLLWLVGGNIPRRDLPALEALGVRGVFPTGSHFDEIVAFIEREAPQ
ncbi:MAG: methylmalonyl-CoA mutase [Gemmatimonadetes bacterium]|nr:methylmalonyl-CoA mutase [Gemmatimonadota bacterium]